MKAKLMPLFGANHRVDRHTTSVLADNNRHDHRVPRLSPDFVRLYNVPGMGHCSGGRATDQADFITPLVKWVEQGKAPQSIIASARGPAIWAASMPICRQLGAANRTRPLCPFPNVAFYKGRGDVESESSFECRAPRKHHHHHEHHDED